MEEQQCKIVQYGTNSFACFEDGRIEVLGTNKSLDFRIQDTQGQYVKDNMDIMKSESCGFVKRMIIKPDNMNISR